MTKTLWYLKQLDLFKGLPKTDLETIVAALHNRACMRGEIVFDPDSKNKVFILKEGTMQVYQLSPEGKKVIIEVLKPGSVFGDLGITSPTETYVEATTDGIICSMEKNRFFEFMSRYSAVSEKLLRYLFAKLVYAEERIASMAVDSVVNRFIKLILDLGRNYGFENQGKVEIKEQFTHEELAQMLGVSRQTMTTIINQLEKRQMITRKQRRISFVKDRLLSSYR